MASKTAVVIVNLGTPDEATPAAVRRYLKEFLSDPRVIEMPRWIWFWILRLVILPLRAKPVAKLYAEIWDEDSPIRSITKQQAEALAKQLPVTVAWGMTYGEPSLRSVLDQLHQEGKERILILPLYPQYSATTNAAIADVVADWVKEQREVPEIIQVKDYWQQPSWVQAVANSITAYRAEHGDDARVLMSFHGIPQSYADKGDRYGERCLQSGEAIAAAAGLQEGTWISAFQSRFGRNPWLPPYTDKTLEQWAQEGVKKVQVVCPGFSADCLETLEEICVENRDLFLQAGGEDLQYIPALNANEEHIDVFATICAPYLKAWGIE
ncbi:MAG TPA: ferrochelatase [Alcanivoracaceae bacterium]|nr:ferrochelatase [Alcanivoracaceae bacterium]